MLPRSENALVLRTDFSDDVAWEATCVALRAPYGIFRANVECISERRFEGLTIPALVGMASGESDPTYVFLVDHATLDDPERPVLVVDLFDEPGRTFRVIPSALGSVENNLSLANIDFVDFVEAADPDGVFRDWRR